MPPALPPAPYPPPPPAYGYTGGDETTVAPSQSPAPTHPVAFVAAGGGGGGEPAVPAAPDEERGEAAAAAPAESSEARRERRLGEVPEALREALRSLEPAVAEPALAFFAKELEGRTGAEQIVLETEADGQAQIVLKLDFEGKSWKRVRKKIKAGVTS